jgi:hypothetical protein
MAALGHRHRIEESVTSPVYPRLLMCCHITANGRKGAETDADATLPKWAIGAEALLLAQSRTILDRETLFFVLSFSRDMLFGWVVQPG